MAASFRLTRLHLASRRVPASLLALAVMAAALRIVQHWTPAAGSYSVTFPLVVAAAAAAVVSVTTRSFIGIYAVQQGWTTPWLWPARPAPDRGRGDLRGPGLRGAVDSWDASRD